ncbi:hypothetical protein HHK36_018971 [Tetracentron sinense]|uniref:Uncharacterized protein n=1 Tax=Tetracentron sinense TaxID=13715 RepID=A0A834Z1D7_TETSI|nr:hypothetical protein HHK36_018971 [Tetracentron sinense]
MNYPYSSVMDSEWSSSSSFVFFRKGSPCLFLGDDIPNNSLCVSGARDQTTHSCIPSSSPASTYSALDRDRDRVSVLYFKRTLTCHGISAVSGKAGAVVGAFVFLYTTQNQDTFKAYAGFLTAIGGEEFTNCAGCGQLLRNDVYVYEM